MTNLVERGELTEEEAQAMINVTTLRPPRMKECILPTPTAMDTKEDALKHATKLLQGKTHRSSGQPIQKTLSDKVMMDLIIKHPELMELYQDHQMEERPNLPPQQEFVDYLRLQTTIKDLAEKTNIKKTTIEHWFRKDDKGFSYPSIENWEQIKPHLKEIKYDKEMTTMESKEWTKKDQRMWPTPTTQETEHPNMKLNEKGRRVSPKGKESHSLNLADKVQMWPTPTQDAATERTKKYAQGGKPLTLAVKEQEMWPTPRASIGMNMSLSEKMATLRHKRYLETEMAYQIQKENPHKTTAKLSPAFVEYLMGFPDGWTNPDISNEQLIKMNTEQKGSSS